MGGLPRYRGGGENKYLEWCSGAGEGGREGGGERDNRPVSEFLEWTRTLGKLLRKFR